MNLQRVGYCIAGSNIHRPNHSCTFRTDRSDKVASWCLDQNDLFAERAHANLRGRVTAEQEQCNY